MNKLVPVVVIVLAVVYFFNDKFDAELIRGKRVLITGSSSGIGEHLAYEYSKLGAKVFITARRKGLLEEVAKKCKELGAQQVEILPTDLGEEKDRDALMAEVKKRFGGLDHLLLNHAILNPGIWKGTKENMTSLLYHMNVNFLSYVDLASQALAMLTEGKGNIGVVSSIAGKFATAGSSIYGTTKHAMQGFFSALRQELLLRNTGVSVTTCVIGPVNTDIMKWTEEERLAMMEKYSGGYDLASTAEDTAVAIIRGVTNREREIYFGRIAWVLVAIHKIFPGYFEDMFGRQSLAVFGVEV